jgi:hypothetical protein
MTSKGLAKSSISGLDIAEAVLRLQRKAARPPEPEVEAFAANVREGIGDDAAMARINDLALASQVASMSLEDFGRNQARFGLERSTLDFLSDH